MSTFYNMITSILYVGVLIALVVMAVSIIGVIVRWRSPARRGHVIRFFAALGAGMCLIGIHLANLFLIELPAMEHAQAAKLAESSLVHVGDTVPPFSLQTADGDELLLPSNDKIVLINFFATWCGPCRAELPHVEEIWLAHKSNERFRLLVIGREDTAQTVRDFRDENGFTFPIAADPDRAIFSLFAKDSIPRTLIVAPGGQIVYSKLGFQEEDLGELKTALEEQLAKL